MSKFSEKNGYLVDVDNNRVDLTKFDNKTAMEMLNSLVDCSDCLDCSDCSRCVNCEDCHDCEDCVDCVAYYDCSDCTSGEPNY